MVTKRELLPIYRGCLEIDADSPILSRYILFAVLNAGVIVPVTYCFFPETAGMRLEDIDHIFEAGGITGGVLSKSGRAIDRRIDIEGTYHEDAEIKVSGPGPMPQVVSEIYEHPGKA